MSGNQPSRREIVGGLVAAGLAGGLATAHAQDKIKPEPVKQRILAISYGALDNADKDQLLMKFLIQLTGKPKPRVCYLPTAKGDKLFEIQAFYRAVRPLSCEPRHQPVFISSSDLKSFDDELLAADALFVGGGNTLNMLAIWKAQEIDKTLLKAWGRGILVAGESAGAMCWFEDGATDSRPGKVTALQCLGWLKGSFCPHYDTEPTRRPTYQRMILAGELHEGIAADEGVGLVYEGEKLVRIVSSRPKANAYRVTRAGDKIEEKVLPAEYLGK
jgi:peptidase E